MENLLEIAKEFNLKYQELWNQNKFEELSNLYSINSILVGYEIVQNRENIAKILQQIYDQGWTKIKIETVKTSNIDDNIILVANIYEAFNSKDANAKPLKTKSSHVLNKIDNVWLTKMHSAF